MAPEPDTQTRPPANPIAVMVHSLNPGGAQRRLVTLANAFAAAGREVHFVALRGGGDVDRLLDPAVKFTVLDPKPKPLWRPWMFTGAVDYTRWWIKHRPKAVLAGITTVHQTALVGTLRGLDDKPIVALRASRHPQRDFPWSRPFKRLFEPVERATRRRLYDQADLVIAVSRETAEALKADMRHPERCVAVPNPTITPEFTASLSHVPDHPWIGGDVPLILGVGRLAWQKRFDVLIDALAIVRRTREFRAIILGEGRFRSGLERQVQRVGLEDAVSLPGNMPDVGAWMAHADLLVSTSAFEGSPGVLIEALAAGLPVVATDCPGGSVELLEDGEGGMLVPMDDAGATAEAILKMLDRPRDRQRLKRIAEPYTVEASAAAYLEALDRAVAQRG